MRTTETVTEKVIFGGIAITGSGDSTRVSQSNDVWRLRLSGSSSSRAWTQDPQPGAAPAARSEATAVLYDDCMFIFGGIAYDESGQGSPTDYNDLWSYDLSAQTWTRIRPSGSLPPKRFSHSADIIEGGLHCVLALC